MPPAAAATGPAPAPAVATTSPRPPSRPRPRRTEVAPPSRRRSSDADPRSTSSSSPPPGRSSSRCSAFYVPHPDRRHRPAGHRPRRVGAARLRLGRAASTGAVYGVDIPGLPAAARPPASRASCQCWLDASDSTPWRALAHLVASTVIAWAFALIALIGIGVGSACCPSPRPAGRSRSTTRAGLARRDAGLMAAIAAVLCSSSARRRPLLRFADRGLTRASWREPRRDPAARGPGGQRRTSAVAAAEHQRTASSVTCTITSSRAWSPSR